VSLAIVHSRAQDGVAAPPVTVEVHLSGGLPGTSIVGLPETAVKEARDRVRVAIQNAQLEYPGRRVTVSLGPADLPKDGGRFDLPIALGILAAAGQVPKDGLARCEFLGELALSGELRAVTGVLPAALKAAAAGRTLIVPLQNGAEAALVSAGDVRGAGSLLDVLAFLRGVTDLPPARALTASAQETGGADLADVRGQQHARRALEIAAAGCHHLLFSGPPGTGKTMLASRLPGILPPLSEAEALESAAVRSVAGVGIDFHKWKMRQFRAPHHTASAGRAGRRRFGAAPGRNLACAPRRAVPRRTARVRPPRARGVARTARKRAHRDLARSASGRVSGLVPARCGNEPLPVRLRRRSVRTLRVHAGRDRRYRARISGPLLDRIDLQVEVPRVPLAELGAEGAAGESSSIVRARVVVARDRHWSGPADRTPP
jgi:magnesium chelatase family protein